MTPGKGRMTAPACRLDNRSRQETESDCSRDRDTTRLRHTPFEHMLRGKPNLMICRLAGGSEQAAVCNVSSPNAGPTCPARLSIA